MDNVIIEKVYCHKNVLIFTSSFALFRQYKIDDTIVQVLYRKAFG